MEEKMNAKSFIFGFVVGGCVSGVAAHFITKHLMEKKCQDEIAEMRERYYSSEYTPKKAEILKEREKPDPETIVEGYKTTENRDIYDRAELERPSEDENEGDQDAPDSYYEDVENPEAIEAMNSDLENIDYDRANSKKDPEEIVESEVGTHGYDVEYLTYYMEDKTFINSQEQIVDDPRDLLGICLETEGFLEREDTSEEIFIRNYRYATDYCITKELGKWDM